MQAMKKKKNIYIHKYNFKKIFVSIVTCIGCQTNIVESNKGNCEGKKGN